MTPSICTALVVDSEAWAEGETNLSNGSGEEHVLWRKGPRRSGHRCCACFLDLFDALEVEAKWSSVIASVIAVRHTTNLSIATVLLTGTDGCHSCHLGRSTEWKAAKPRVDIVEAPTCSRSTLREVTWMLEGIEWRRKRRLEERSACIYRDGPSRKAKRDRRCT